MRVWPSLESFPFPLPDQDTISFTGTETSLLAYSQDNFLPVQVNCLGSHNVACSKHFIYWGLRLTPVQPHKGLLLRGPYHHYCGDYARFMCPFQFIYLCLQLYFYPLTAPLFSSVLVNHPKVETRLFPLSATRITRPQPDFCCRLHGPLRSQTLIIHVPFPQFSCRTVIFSILWSGSWSIRMVHCTPFRYNLNSSTVHTTARQFLCVM